MEPMGQHAPRVPLEEWAGEVHQQEGQEKKGAEGPRNEESASAKERGDGPNVEMHTTR